MAVEAIGHRLRSLAGQVRCLPPRPRRELEPLLARSTVALASMRESQALADERTLLDRLEAARRVG